MLIIHICSTISSLILGYYIFTFSRTTGGLFFVLCGSLLIAAISGILLNTYTFTPFHILSIVTIITIPLVIRGVVIKKNHHKALRGAFYNFLGLNIAFIGALFPQRMLGYRLRIKLLSFESHLSQSIMTVILIITIIIAGYFVRKSIVDKKFFSLNGG